MLRSCRAMVPCRFQAHRCLLDQDCQPLSLAWRWCCWFCRCRCVGSRPGAGEIVSALSSLYPLSLSLSRSFSLHSLVFLSLYLSLSLFPSLPLSLCFFCSLSLYLSLSLSLIVPSCCISLPPSIFPSSLPSSLHSSLLASLPLSLPPSLPLSLAPFLPAPSLLLSS